MIIPERPIPGSKIPLGWFCDFYDYVISQRLRGDGRTFFTKDTDTGRVGSTRSEGYTPGSSGGAEAGYDGPFKVVTVPPEDPADPTTEVKVSGQTFTTYLDIGLIALEYTEGNVSGITTSGWVYMSLTYNTTSSVFEYALGHATTLPTQTMATQYVRLAYVTCVDGSITSVFQWHHGALRFDGRFY
jgi:hypothetical protein